MSSKWPAFGTTAVIIISAINSMAPVDPVDVAEATFASEPLSIVHHSLHQGQFSMAPISRIDEATAETLNMICFP